MCQALHASDREGNESTLGLGRGLRNGVGDSWTSKEERVMPCDFFGFIATVKNGFILQSALSRWHDSEELSALSQKPCVKTAL